MQVLFIDGIRQGDTEEVDTLESPWLQIKDGQGQVYWLQSNPNIPQEQYLYSIFQRPAGGFEEK